MGTLERSSRISGAYIRGLFMAAATDLVVATVDTPNSIQAMAESHERYKASFVRLTELSKLRGDAALCLVFAKMQREEANQLKSVIDQCVQTCDDMMQQLVSGDSGATTPAIGALSAPRYPMHRRSRSSNLNANSVARLGNFCSA